MNCARDPDHGQAVAAVERVNVVEPVCARCGFAALLDDQQPARVLLLRTARIPTVRGA